MYTRSVYNRFLTIEKRSGSQLYVRCPFHDDSTASLTINEDTDEVLATVSNKRLEKALDDKVNLIGVDKLRVKAGRISDDNNFEFGYNGGYLYNLYLTPITQK